MQNFKGDELEIKISGAAEVVFNQLLSEMKAWFDGAYSSTGLGEILYDNKLVPLTQAVARDIFIKNYGAILEKWEYVGSFESYIYVFQQIFGPTTAITFERLSPGALKINISTQQTGFFKWLNKLGGNYISDHNGNNINLLSVVGIGDFYEVHGVLDSLNPAGIYLLINFTLQRS